MSASSSPKPSVVSPAPVVITWIESAAPAIEISHDEAPKAKGVRIRVGVGIELGRGHDVDGLHIAHDWGRGHAVRSQGTWGHFTTLSHVVVALSGSIEGCRGGGLNDQILPWIVGQLSGKDLS